MTTTLNIEQLTAAQKANAEVITTLIRTAFGGVERLAALNIAASRDFFNSSVAGTQQLLAAKNPGELGKLNSELSQPGLQKWLDYSRNVYELVTELQKEVSGVLESQYGNLTTNVSAAAEQASAKLPVGGDVLTAAVKSIIDASNKAFESFSSLGKQVAEITESNLQTAAATAVQAVEAVKAAAPAAAVEAAPAAPAPAPVVEEAAPAPAAAPAAPARKKK